MRIIVVFLAFFLTLSQVCAWRHFRHGKWWSKKGVSVNRIGPPEQWFEQKLDHFDITNTKTWKQRYFTNDTFFKNDSPIFLMIGGEGEISPLWMLKGMWIEWAKKFNALCFQLEHRFYGRSHPTKDMSTKNLRYLSSEQALADLAYFIEAKKDELQISENKWIVFGGSYPGSLAAWFRLKYPHLAYAAVASSAPLQAQINFKEYLGVVNDALQSSSQGAQCTAAIEQATAAIEDAIQSSDCCKTFDKLFRLCDPLDTSEELDLANLFETLAGNFQGVVQYNKDNRLSEGSKSANITIDVVCDIMTNPSLGSPLARYAVVNSIILDSTDEKCLDYKYNKYIKNMRSKSWNSTASNGGRQWTYQTCTEFGYYQSSDLDDQPFGTRFPIDFSVRQCSDIFGLKFNFSLLQAAVDRTNFIYGGLGIKATRTVFPNGSIDPWHALGITNNQNGNIAIYINGTAHCADMYPPSEKDSLELKAAREIVESYLLRWIQE